MKTYLEAVQNLVAIPATDASQEAISGRRELLHEAAQAVRSDLSLQETDSEPHENIIITDTARDTYVEAVHDLVSISATDPSPEAARARRKAVVGCSLAAPALDRTVADPRSSERTDAFAEYDQRADARRRELGFHA